MCLTLLIALVTATAAIFTVPKVFGIHIYAVVSGSMEPAYPVGSLVFTKETDAGQIGSGDCITYYFGQDVVTHRVVGVDAQENLFYTKGDASHLQDPPVTFDRVIGRTFAFCIPFLGYLVVWLSKAEVKLVLLGTAVVLSTFLCLKFLLYLKRRPQSYETKR